MSWQFISVIVLLFAIGGGMLWYERSRPPSQIVALVAVLAALAVAGRIVLAPIPNVVATTDIVIIAGFVLGPAPGFAVGALGGLVSNFWLGQGVWTPWQMIAWGMCGIGGGVLWKLTGGRINRWWLAAFCGAAGVAFGAWMNLQTMVSFGGEISLDRYLALEVRAIPFDIAHMTGNFVFALAAGPAMIAALTRFRKRFEWHQADPDHSGPQSTTDRQVGGGSRTATGLMMILTGALLLVFAGSSSPQRADAAFTAQASKAAVWLETQQNIDGGFSSMPGGASSVNITARAMFALASAGINPLDVKTNATPYGYLINHRSGIKKASDIALTILALKTVRQDPRDFKGRNLIKALRDRRGNGSFGDDVNVTAFAVLAFRSVGAINDARYSLEWLYKVQNENGGWGIARDAPSGSDSTGTVLMAITNEKAANRAIGYLAGIQKQSGGFGSSGNANAQSTGLVMQGLVAQDRSVNYLERNGNTAADYLLSLQKSDGSILYARNNDATRVWVTADGTPALAGAPLPIAAPPHENNGSGNPGNNSGGATPDSGGSSTGGTSTGGTSTGGTSTYTPPAGSLATPSGSSGGNGNSGSSDNGGNGNSGTPNPGSGNSGGTDTTVDPATDLPPADTSIPLVPVAPDAAILAASEAGPQPSPLIAILIALGVSGGLCGGSILLVRRFRW